MLVRICFVFVGFVFGVVNCQGTSCTTPNGQASSCVPLLRCPILIQAAASNEPIALKFLEHSICDEKTSTVCCGTTGNFTKPVTTPKPLSAKEKFDALSMEAKKDYVLQKLLPSKKICGFQHTDDYFYNSTETSVDEFPWLVYVIEVHTQHDQNYYLRREANCVGALISKQYVISSKVCRNYAQWFGTTRNSIDMLFGLHHIHKNVNCIGTQFGVEDCTDPPLRASSSQWKIFEDVVLFRLDNKIAYSDFVRPICLPQQPQEIPTAGTLIMASGWAEEEFVTGKSVKLKKRMKYTTMSNKDCQTNNPEKDSICGVPLEDNTHYMCTGDVGGPLMYRHLERNWFAVGVIYQSGIHVCDEAQPITAKRLTPEIVDWIIENIEP